jgi:tryptophan synthase alpha chain
MNRLQNRLAALKNNNEKALILYITAGDPDLVSTLNIMNALAENGTDCIELGVPFSDPMADGPIIQRSSQRALQAGFDMDRIFAIIQKFRHNHDTPVVLMGYYNPVLHYGNEKFFDALKNAGGDGVIIADLPYEEGEEVEKICRERELCLIYLLAPEIGSERTRKILDASSGFVYCVSHYGTTGMQNGPAQQMGAVIASLKAMTSLPIAVGFGISNDNIARETSQYADGIIIGSWLIKELENSINKVQTASEFSKHLKNIIS